MEQCEVNLSSILAVSLVWFALSFITADQKCSTSGFEIKVVDYAFQFSTLMGSSSSHLILLNSKTWFLINFAEYERIIFIRMIAFWAHLSTTLWTISFLHIFFSTKVRILVTIWDFHIRANIFLHTTACSTKSHIPWEVYPGILPYNI